LPGDIQLLTGDLAMSKLLSLSVGAIASVTFSVTEPAAAKDYEYCRRDVTSFMLQCRFETLAQCQGTSFGRGGDCLRNPSLGSAANTYAYAPYALGVRKTYAYARRFRSN
jgi:hypothetical protein